MALVFNRDGSVTFLADDGSNAKQTIVAGTPEATWLPQYATFQAAHSAPAVLTPPPPSLFVFPQTDPGVTGAAFIANNTLKVSLGSNPVAVQIGATGATGLAVVL